MNRSQQSKQAAQLVEAVRTVRDAFTRARLDGTETLGMQVMLVLHNEDGLSLKKCAETLAVGPTNVSKAVSKLEASGLVGRTAADHRTNALTLTREGRGRVEQFLNDVNS